MALINAIRKTPNIYGIYEYIENVSADSLPIAEWDHDPDLSAVTGIDRKYWKFVAPSVVPMPDSEALAVRLNLVPEYADYMYTVQNSGRFYMYGDERWVTESDDNYGMSYYQFVENGGTGDNPVAEWEHQGTMIEQGERVKRFTMNARVNSNDITDWQIRLIARFPTNPTRWRTGLSGDANMTNVTLLDGLFMNPTDIINWDVPYSGNPNTHHRRTINVDYQFPSDGWLSLYVRPRRAGTQTNTRYLMATYRYDIIAVHAETQL